MNAIRLFRTALWTGPPWPPLCPARQNAAGIGRCAELRFKDTQAGALLLELVNEVEHIAGRT
jgi:hypothetical protein